MRSITRGFTLIELLIVVAVIGIIAAIAIPNLMNALQRGRQKRTMADMRTISTAVGAYESDANFYPRGVADINELAAHLEPVYLQAVPETDGWYTPYGVIAAADGSNYTLVSYGRNKISDGFLGAGTRTSRFSADIYMADGEFVQFPEGLQTAD